MFLNICDTWNCEAIAESFFPLESVNECLYAYSRQITSWLCVSLVSLNAYLGSREIPGIPCIPGIFFSWLHLFWVAQNDEGRLKYYTDTELGRLAQGDKSGEPRLSSQLAFLPPDSVWASPTPCHRTVWRDWFFWSPDSASWENRSRSSFCFFVMLTQLHIFFSIDFSILWDGESKFYA